jgi:hypothetical protein
LDSPQVSAKIAETAVAEITEHLKARGTGVWRSVNWEFQDDGEFVLFTIELAEVPLERNAPERWYIYDVLEKRIPPKSDGTYSWMVVFTHNGDVCDSLMSGVA